MDIEQSSTLTEEAGVLTYICRKRAKRSSDSDDDASLISLKEKPLGFIWQSTQVIKTQ